MALPQINSVSPSCGNHVSQHVDFSQAQKNRPVFRKLRGVLTGLLFLNDLNIFSKSILQHFNCHMCIFKELVVAVIIPPVRACCENIP